MLTNQHWECYTRRQVSWGWVLNHEWDHRVESRNDAAHVCHATTDHNPVTHDDSTSSLTDRHTATARRHSDRRTTTAHWHSQIDPPYTHNHTCIQLTSRSVVNAATWYSPSSRRRSSRTTGHDVADISGHVDKLWNFTALRLCITWVHQSDYYQQQHVSQTYLMTTLQTQVDGRLFYFSIQHRTLWTEITGTCLQITRTAYNRVTPQANRQHIDNTAVYIQCLQCFDAVGWAAGRASSL